MVLAYPVPSNETTAIISRDAFLEAMRDRELALKVREREPKTLDETYRTALRLEAYNARLMLKIGDDLLLEFGRLEKLT